MSSTNREQAPLGTTWSFVSRTAGRTLGSARCESLIRHCPASYLTNLRTPRCVFVGQAVPLSLHSPWVPPSRCGYGNAVTTRGPRCHNLGIGPGSADKLHLSCSCGDVQVAKTTIRWHTAEMDGVTHPEHMHAFVIDFKLTEDLAGCDRLSFAFRQVDGQPNSLCTGADETTSRRHTTSRRKRSCHKPTSVFILHLASAGCSKVPSRTSCSNNHVNMLHNKSAIGFPAAPSQRHHGGSSRTDASPPPEQRATEEGPVFPARR